MFRNPKKPPVFLQHQVKSTNSLQQDVALLNKFSLRIAADAARALDYAKIPNVLWGWLAVGLLGEDFRYPEVDFVVSDGKLQSAIEALVAAGFTLCTDSACRERKEDRVAQESSDRLSKNELNAITSPSRYHAVPDAHFHLDPSSYEYYTVLSLFTQSRFLWKGWWPELTLTAARTDTECPVADSFSPDHPHLMLSSDLDFFDNKDGSGPWMESPYAVKVLRPSLFAEALTYLWRRNWGDTKNVFMGWRAMLVLGLLYAKWDNDQRDNIRRGLKPEFMPVWDGLLGLTIKEDKNIHKRLLLFRKKAA
ncbi:uncharacterized protein BDV14DRAFT_200294 [Aspergillus stella-maris]|uniref:uncharacterized protein n=1 Tax=Aspergillus stella-maris TaxID=1810926 RepID=UPI003CCD51BA